MTSERIEGGCLCKAIRYRVTGVPVSSIICHCNSCRKASSAPSVAWLTFASANFELLAGAPREFQSSPGVARTFCGRCGSPLTYKSVREPDTIDVTTASLDRPEQFPPVREVWLEHKLGWEAVNGSLAKFRTGSGDGV